MKKILFLLGIIFLVSCGEPDVYKVNYMDLLSKSKALNEKYKDQIDKELLEVVDNVDLELYNEVYNKIGLNDAQQTAMKSVMSKVKSEYSDPEQFRMWFGFELVKDVFTQKNIDYSNLKHELIKYDLGHYAREYYSKYDSIKIAKVEELNKKWKNKTIEELGFDEEDWKIFTKGSQRIIDMNDFDRLKSMTVGEIIKSQKSIEN